MSTKQNKSDGGRGISDLLRVPLIPHEHCWGPSREQHSTDTPQSALPPWAGAGVKFTEAVGCPWPQPAHIVAWAGLHTGSRRAKGSVREPPQWIQQLGTPLLLAESSQAPIQPIHLSMLLLVKFSSLRGWEGQCHFTARCRVGRHHGPDKWTRSLPQQEARCGKLYSKYAFVIICLVFTVSKAIPLKLLSFMVWFIHNISITTLTSWSQYYFQRKHLQCYQKSQQKKQFW